MATTLSPSHVAIVKATAPALREHGVKITSLFYENMLAGHPELRHIFNEANQKTGQQPRALANAVFAYASYVDDMSKLTNLVQRIAHKHASLNVQPEQYAVVGKFLLEAVATVLGDACTPEVAEAWTAAYDEIASLFINQEKQLYTSYGPWKGWRRFRVQKKVEESNEITSFYLAPEDGVALPEYLPGQYISIRLDVPSLGIKQPRQYSLSDHPSSEYYRISVKKESASQGGSLAIVSPMLHEEVKEGTIVELTHPTGDFYAKPGDTTPMVLISAGVGITPMMSIMKSVLASGSSRRISVVHGAHNAKVRAFAQHLRESSEKQNVQTTLFLSEVGEDDKAGVDYDFQGRVDLDKVAPERLCLGEPDAQYYICGPDLFMRDIRRYLLNHQVSQDRCHLEIFGVDSESF